MRLPDLLDPWRAVDNGSVFAGRLPLSGLPRLTGVLLNTAGDVVYRLEFARDPEYHGIMTGRVEAHLTLCCQRCMEPLRVAVDARVALALVSSLDEARALPERYDPLLVGEDLIRPRDLIEDELLLGIPQIPMHDSGSCSVAVGEAAGGSGEQSPEASPFKVLADLKRKI
jgi:uncharacterized protein